MILATIAALALGPTAADFFPLAEGTKWTYRDSDGREYVDRAGKALEIGGAAAVPVTTEVAGRVVDTVHYRAEGGTLWIVAYDPKLPLEPARPVFQVGDSRQKWQYEGGAAFAGDPIPLRLSGESVAKGAVQFEERSLPALEVKIKARMESGGLTMMEASQSCVYGKGVGLIQMTETGKAAGKPIRRTLKLVRFEPGAGQEP